MSNIDFNNLPYAVDNLLEKVSEIKEIVSRIENNQPVDEPDQLTAERALVFINKAGYPISKSKLYKLTSSNGIPCRRFGSRLIFNKLELLDWCEAQN